MALFAKSLCCSNGSHGHLPWADKDTSINTKVNSHGSGMKKSSAKAGMSSRCMFCQFVFTLTCWQFISEDIMDFEKLDLLVIAAKLLETNR